MIFSGCFLLPIGGDRNLADSSHSMLTKNLFFWRFCVAFRDMVLKFQGQYSIATAYHFYIFHYLSCFRFHLQPGTQAQHQAVAENAGQAEPADIAG